MGTCPIDVFPFCYRALRNEGSNHASLYCCYRRHDLHPFRQKRGRGHRGRLGVSVARGVDVASCVSAGVGVDVPVVVGTGVGVDALLGVAVGVSAGVLVAISVGVGVEVLVAETVGLNVAVGSLTGDVNTIKSAEGKGVGDAGAGEGSWPQAVANSPRTISQHRTHLGPRWNVSATPLSPIQPL